MSKMKEIRIVQIKSAIDRKRSQKKTLRALGIHRMNEFVVKHDTPQIRGMIEKVKHLLRVDDL